MKNYEKYDINSLGINRCDYMYKKMFGKTCGDDWVKCEHCPLLSLETFYKWSQEESKEPIQLSHDEYVILKNVVSDKFNMISRDGQHNNIFLEGNSWITSLSFYSHLFKFIKNGEQYLIKQLVADYEKEHGDGN